MELINKFNDWIALKITNAVGTMWCAYAFAVLALVSLPDAIKGGTATLIAWIAQTFLQLVLLSLIMVGQRVAGVATEVRDNESHDAVMAELQILKELHVEFHAALGIKTASLDVSVEHHEA